MIQFLQDQIKHNQFFFTAIIAGIASFGVIYFKSFFGYLYTEIRRRLIFTAQVYQSDPLFSDFEIWFFNHYGEKYKNVEASVNEKSDIYPEHPDSSKFKKPTVFFKQSEGVFLIKYSGKYILIRKGREKLEHAHDARSMFFNQYHFFSINGSIAVKKLLEEAVEFSGKKSKPNEIKIFSNNSYGEWSLTSKISAKKITDVILPAHKQLELIADMDEFVNSKEEYDKRHIFYKRGYGFEGAPGNGKTSLALAMASYLGKDIYNLDLNTISDNGNVKVLFSNLTSNSLLLIEDIDCFFQGRKPVKADSKISFSTFLNAMDGALYKEGLVTVITTNDKASLDSALIRKGRIDFMFEVPKPGLEEINQYLKVFFDTEDIIMAYEKELSMCDVQDICLNNKNDYQQAVKQLIN